MMFTLTGCPASEDGTWDLKYVFLFIGDGMSFNAVQLTRDAIASRYDSVIPAELSFTDFDTVGLFTNYDAESFIPESSSSGTAMATGIKTNSVCIAETSWGEEKDSIATLLKEELDMKVGIITTANMNHATPAVFYGHSASRYNYYEIGEYLPKSDFDLFIGGQFLDPEGGGEHLSSLAKKEGYTVIDTKENIFGKKDKNKKHLIIDPWCDSSGMMSFSIDRPKEAPTLANYLEMGIELLDNEKGFFIMCEGGRIDSALHANDAATAMHEVIAFSDAIGAALDFYEKYPNETLILVTGDHETGGLSLGYTGSGYTIAPDKLFEQKISYLTFDNEYVTRYKNENTPLDSILKDVESLFGLEDISEYERTRLEKAWEKTLLGSDGYTEEDKLNYGTRTPITAELTRLLANRAGIDFSTYVHTAAPMVLWAKGKDEAVFGGTYDNTDVYNKLYSLFFK